MQADYPAWRTTTILFNRACPRSLPLADELRAPPLPAPPWSDAVGSLAGGGLFSSINALILFASDRRRTSFCTESVSFQHDITLWRFSRQQDMTSPRLRWTNQPHPPGCTQSNKWIKRKPSSSPLILSLDVQKLSADADDVNFRRNVWSMHVTFGGSTSRARAFVLCGYYLLDPTLIQIRRRRLKLPPALRSNARIPPC